MEEALSNLLKFLDDLRAEGVNFRLGQSRSTAIMVEVFVPRERWEIEFFADGSIDVDRFVGAEGVQNAPHLRELWATIRGVPSTEDFDNAPRQ